MKALYKFFVDVGRMGSLSGVFIANKQEIEDLIGEEVYFGEILGKHSEVYFDIEEDHLELITTDADFISKFEEYKLETGTNPLWYYNNY